MTAPATGSVIQSRVLALLMKGWIERHNKPQVKFSYLLELVRSLRYLVQRANIMSSHDDLTAMVFINAERFIDSCNSIHHSLHTILFTSFGISAKCCEDDRLFNTHIAQACGMRLDHLNKMEMLFLTQLQFEVIPQPEQISAFFADAKKRWVGRPSVTINHTPFYSVSRLVASLLHSNKDSSSSPSPSSSSSSSRPTATRTHSSPAFFFHSSSTNKPSSPLITSPSSVSFTPIQRVTATRTISTPNLINATPMTASKPSSLLSNNSNNPKPVLISDKSSKELSKRTEKTTTRLLNFFRSRDE